MNDQEIILKQAEIITHNMNRLKELERGFLDKCQELGEAGDRIAELESKLATLPSEADYRRLLEYASVAWHQIECEWGLAGDPPDADILLIDRLMEAFTKPEEKK